MISSFVPPYYVTWLGFTRKGEVAGADGLFTKALDDLSSSI